MTYEEKMKRTKVFRHDRFGMFIHWGLYSIPARGEWVRSWEEMPEEDYQKYFDEFDPVQYDPKKWARLAKEAGMKYAVMTTKHHDGFCLFDSAYTDYKATNTKAGRDLIREYADAFRAEGIKVGFYYSLIDWHHPDFPHYGDMVHPMRNNENYKNDNRNFDRYLEYMHNQVRELVTNYGKIDIMWFDYSYGDMRGEMWKATELVNMIHSYQPDILINNRLLAAGEDRNAGDDAPIYAGDFKSPEQMIPEEALVDDLGREITWETCITLNDHWGYCGRDRNWKSAKQVIRTLVECVSKGGNMLLNIGPDAKGNIPKQSIEILQEVAEWMYENSESIYGCGNANLPKPAWGRYTRNGNTLYAHVYDNATTVMTFDPDKKVKSVRYVRDGSEIQIKNPWNVDQYAKQEHTFHIDLQHVSLDDDIDTVIKINLED